MLTLSLSTPADFDFHATVTSHGWYQLAPNHYNETTHILQRPYELRNGRCVQLTLRGGKSKLLIITLHGQAIISSKDRNDILRKVEMMFNLHRNLTPFYQQMAKKDGYQWIAEKNSARLLSSPTVWEDLVKTVLTTNTSWSNTIKMVEQVSALDPNGIFPSPEQIVALSEDDFAEKAGAGYRAPYIYEAAQRIVDGEIDLKQWQALDSDALYKAITDLKGFGDYAAGTLLRLMGHYDKLAIDTVARKAYEMVTGNPPESDTDIRDYYESFGKWRGLALWMDCIRDEIDTAPQAIVD